MSRCWVVNASPLILLGKIDRLTLLDDLADQVVIPTGVVREVGAKPGGDQSLGGFIKSERFQVCDTGPIPRIFRFGISGLVKPRS